MATQVEFPTRTDVAAEIRRMGHTFNEDVLKTTYALFTALQERAPRDGVTAIRDLSYGPDERHRLDVFTPALRPAMPVPMVMYFHGGGFIAGERSPIPGLIYDNVPTFCARNGLVGVNATYRLAPDHKWPSGGADVGAAVAWVRDNASNYGGDPDRIFIMGQSAGASHVAAYTFIKAVHGDAGPGIAGAILLSGSYAPLDPNFSDGAPAPNQVAYYGDDLDSWADKSPLYHVAAGHPPVFLAVAEFDPYPLAWPTAALYAALVKCDRALPRLKMLQDHNHVSPAMQINTEIDALGPDILDFVAGRG